MKMHSRIHEVFELALEHVDSPKPLAQASRACYNLACPRIYRRVRIDAKAQYPSFFLSSGSSSHILSKRQLLRHVRHLVLSCRPPVLDLSTIRDEDWLEGLQTVRYDFQTPPAYNDELDVQSSELLTTLKPVTYLITAWISTIRRLQELGMLDPRHERLRHLVSLDPTAIQWPHVQENPQQTLGNLEIHVAFSYAHFVNPAELKGLVKWLGVDTGGSLLVAPKRVTLYGLGRMLHGRPRDLEELAQRAGIEVLGWSAREHGPQQEEDIQLVWQAFFRCCITALQPEVLKQWERTVNYRVANEFPWRL